MARRTRSNVPEFLFRSFSLSGRDEGYRTLPHRKLRYRPKYPEKMGLVAKDPAFIGLSPDLQGIRDFISLDNIILMMHGNDVLAQNRVVELEYSRRPEMMASKGFLLANRTGQQAVTAGMILDAYVRAAAGILAVKYRHAVADSGDRDERDQLNRIYYGFDDLGNYGGYRFFGELKNQSRPLDYRNLGELMQIAPKFAADAVMEVVRSYGLSHPDDALPIDFGEQAKLSLRDWQELEREIRRLTPQRSIKIEEFAKTARRYAASTSFESEREWVVYPDQTGYATLNIPVNSMVLVPYDVNGVPHTAATTIFDVPGAFSQTPPIAENLAFAGLWVIKVPGISYSARDYEVARLVKFKDELTDMLVADEGQWSRGSTHTDVSVLGWVREAWRAAFGGYLIDRGIADMSAMDAVIPPHVYWWRQR
jgi:hypothetical protein